MKQTWTLALAIVLTASASFGQPSDPLSAAARHSFEHYGNIVTYIRLKGLVPPSSQ